MRFLPGEWFVVRIILTLAALDTVLLYSKNIPVDVVGYASIIGIGLFLVAAGQYYRVIRHEGRLALALIAAGLFVLFTIIGSIFNYMFLPNTFAPIDDFLMQVDAAMGYHWPTLLIWVSNYPWFGTFLYQVYFTSLPQLLVIILVLGFMGEAQQLHRFLLTGVIGALLAIVIWALFPNFGAKSFHDLPQSVLDAFPIAVTPAYGDALLALSRDGVEYLSPKNVLGLIGFPSFHTVMACMSVCFVPRHRILMPVIFCLNAFMALAILVQGGHHLIDMIGGVGVFAIAYALSGLTMRKLSIDYQNISELKTV
ncbi:hypothetical protein ADU59_17775 [Pararhizobium polonicum]|uniref:Inositolphosphotransferase Aur1/Ipt1 domain-containing protein n=1 Tax=Pararhizobium polonicum TaxID=1612624 RepID=A0A1C7NYG4_9HYPH|nr:phosphatase PAP2 family protein [Pararhizobium polonicum]OBZ94052.1 hypothetical protein ADU59_17775 [Pararhizobium polonicum]